MPSAPDVHSPDPETLLDEAECLDLGAVSETTRGIGGEVPEGLTTYAP